MNDNENINEIIWDFFQFLSVIPW